MNRPAPLEAVEAHVRANTWIGQADIEPITTDELMPILIVRCPDVGTARLHAATFGIDISHTRHETYRRDGFAVFAGYGPWRGWHVMVCGREPLTVAAPELAGVAA